MSKKYLLLYGNGSFAHLLKWYIDHDDPREIAAVTVEQQYITDPFFEEKKILPFEQIEEFYPPDETEILLGVGYSGMNTVRQKIFESCKEKGYSIAQYVHSSAILNDVHMGEGNIILEDTLVEPFVEIGMGNLIWYRISIAHNVKIGDYNTIAGMASICGFTNIGNNCFIGNACVIRDKIEIADYTLVGAAAYVSKNTEQYSVIAAPKGIVLPGKKSTDFNI